MTILMTLVGIVVALVSCFRNPFKVAAKRFALCAISGLLIDMSILTLSAVATAVALI